MSSSRRRAPSKYGSPFGPALPGKAKPQRGKSGGKRKAPLAPKRGGVRG